MLENRLYEGNQMKAFTKPTEPFAFWLTQQFLPIEDNSEEDIQPIGNREFFCIICIIAGVLGLLEIVFKGIIF
jgi:hypothetical protein